MVVEVESKRLGCFMYDLMETSREEDTVEIVDPGDLIGLSMTEGGECSRMALIIVQPTV